MIGNPLIDFFIHNGTDNRGRVLLQIVGQSDEWLESIHDFIQWLFPLSEASGANPNAPLIDVNLVSLFGFNEAARSNMLLGLDRMLSFYGLQRKGTSITKGENWYLREDNWFDRPTHNDLRITRMLKSLSILGFGDHAQAFLYALLKLSNELDCGFSSDAIGYWKSAVSAKWEPHSGEYPAAEGEYMQATREELQKGIRSLLKMARRFSELEGLGKNETFRMDQIRFRAALIARQTGVMGRSDFQAECDRHAVVLADAMGGTAYHIDLH